MGDVAQDQAESGPDLMLLVAGLAAELEDVRADGDGGLVSYLRGDVIFARASADALELRLPPDIADAAGRADDTEELPGAPGWVRLSPRVNERHVADRATAWFRTAWRHAGR